MQQTCSGINGNVSLGGTIRQDYHMWQLQKTLAYAKALQYWAEKVQLPHPGNPADLAEGMWELCQAMKPLATFNRHEDARG